MDAYTNFAVSTVATAPSPASSGTSLVVASGHGTRFPAPPFNASVWPVDALPTPATAEIVRVTGMSTDTLTISRAQESTTARSITVGDLIAATITKKTLDDLVAASGARIGAIGIIIDGGGSPITTGVKGDLYIPFACTITASTLIADVSGSVVLDLLLSASFATVPTVSIVASAPPTLSSALNGQDATLASWTVAIAAGSRLRYSVTSVSTITRLTHTLTVQAT